LWSRGVGFSVPLSGRRGRSFGKVRVGPFSGYFGGSPTARTATRKSQAEQKKGGGVRTAKVIYVVDGDTVIVGSSWRKETLRLGAIDCPEGDQPWGDTAKYGLIKLIGGCEVRLQEHATDRYGRTVATVHVWDHRKKQWINVNERMVILGHAWVLRGYLQHLTQERRDELFRLEKWARTKNIGLWKDANPIPPWKWRNPYKRTELLEKAIHGGRTTSEPTSSVAAGAPRYEPSLSPEKGIDSEPVSTDGFSADAASRIPVKRESKLVGMVFWGAVLLLPGFVILGVFLGGPQTFTTQRSAAPSASPSSHVSDFIYVTAQAANIRGGPSMENSVIDVVKKGKRLELLGTQGNWHKVRDRATRRVGWIHRSIVSEQPLGR
jgi:micrococcal nuclease